MDKTELLEALEDNRLELMEMVADLPDEVLLEAGVVGEWSIKEILAHLSYWEGQIVTLLYQARQGIDKPTTVHFGKLSADELNKRWYEQGKERPLEAVWQDWLGVRKQTIRRVSEFTDSDLNDPKRFPWLEDKALYEWILLDTIEHEDEHADQIREWLDRRDTQMPGDEDEQPGANNGSAH